MESFFTNLESCLTVSPRKEVPNGLWILGMPSFWHGSHRSHGCWKLKEANGPPSGRNAATAQTDGVVPCAALALDLRFGTMAPQCPCSPPYMFPVLNAITRLKKSGVRDDHHLHSPLSRSHTDTTQLGIANAA